MGMRRTIIAGMLLALLGACSSVYGVASWHSPTYQLDLPTSFSGLGQTVIGSKPVVVDHDADCTLRVTAGTNGEVLKNGTATLATRYKLTGASLQTEDSSWVDAADFVNNRSYLVQGNLSNDTLTLWVEAKSPASSVLPAGNYTADVVLTVSW